MVVHILHALEQVIVDNNVIVIHVGTFSELTITQPFADNWIAFSIGKDFTFYSINGICTTLGEPRS